MEINFWLIYIKYLSSFSESKSVFLILCLNMFRVLVFLLSLVVISFHRCGPRYDIENWLSLVFLSGFLKLLTDDRVVYLRYNNNNNNNNTYL